jgi:hypothetical protein
METADIGCRLTREGHAWFWERLRVKVPRGRTISCFPPFGKDRFGIPKPPRRAWDCKNTGRTGLDPEQKNGFCAGRGLAILFLTERRCTSAALKGGANKCYISFMTKRFEQAVAEIRKLPGERQDQVAELLIELASEDATRSP